MKKTFYISRNELYSLFYSPIAWLLLILFLILTSADYLGALEGAVGNFERGGFYLMFVRDLTNTVLNGVAGYFPKVISNLYVFFPLITMGLISREINNGTIRLLYSSPVRVREIVAGKFLAMVCFTLVLLALLLFTLIALSWSLTRPDYVHMAASLVGLFLVLCTYAAIGLFISALTSYQIVAAIITFAVFAFLSKVGDLWQESDLLRNITYYLNIGGKSGNLIRGLFNLRDVGYFIAIILAFLAFTVIKIRSDAQSISWYQKVSRYLAVVAGLFLIGYLTSRPQWNVYADATRDKLYTVTPPTQTKLAAINKSPLEVTVFVNLFKDFWRFKPDQQNSILTNVWEPYIRFKPDIHLKYAYYYDTDTGSYLYKNNPGKTLKEIAEKEALTYKMNVDQFLSPDSIKKLTDVKKEEYRNFFRVSYQGKSTILRTFDDIQYWPSENEIAAAINRLISTPPRISFLTGEIERDPFADRDRDYKLITSQLGNRMALINQGYDFDTLSLKDKEIPKGIAALVIADPRVPFSAPILQKISHYIAGGGNLFIAAEPDRREVVMPLFDQLGVSIRDGLLIQPSDKLSNDQVFPYLTNRAKKLSPQFESSFHDQTKFYGDTLFRVGMGGAGVLDYVEKDGFKVEPLLKTDPERSWNRLAPINPDSLQTKVTPRQDDEHGSFATALLLERNVNNVQQRIIVASDADYLTQPLFNGWEPKRFNYTFGFWSFSYFSYGKFPADTRRPQTDDSLDVTVADLAWQRIMLYYVLPSIIALLAFIVLLRRKRK